MTRASALRQATAPAGSFFVFETEDEAQAFEERAAIREHEGGLPRAAAERLAAMDIIAQRSARAAHTLPQLA